jgi:hypothetical protein
LSTAEFWSLTLREFFQLTERRKQHMLREDLRTAILASIYVNAHRKEGTPEVSPFRFVLDSGANAESQVSSKQPWQMQKAVFESGMKVKFPAKK